MAQIPKIEIKIIDVWQSHNKIFEFVDWALIEMNGKYYLMEHLQSYD